MTSTVSQSTTRPAFRPSFHLWLTVGMSFFIFAGFGITYWTPMATGAMPPTPPIVHIHGFLFSGWMILLMVQSLLVNVKNVPLHRSLGMFGVSMGTALALVGLLISLLSAATSLRNSPPDLNYDLMYLSYAAVLLFSILFILAIRQVRVPRNHRQLILFATIPLLPPGINRLYMEAFNLGYVPVFPTYLTMDVFVALLLWHDWRTNGKFTFYTLVGVGLVLGQQLLHWPVVNTDAFVSFTEWSAGLMVYR